MDRGREGRFGRGGGIGRGRIRNIFRGQHATTSKEKAKQGISKALGNAMFAYTENSSANDMKTTREKAIQNIGIDIVKDISTELRTRTLMLCKVQLQNTTNTRLQKDRQQVLDSLTAAVTAKNPYAILKTSEIQNEVEEDNLEI